MLTFSADLPHPWAPMFGRNSTLLETLQSPLQARGFCIFEVVVFNLQPLSIFHPCKKRMIEHGSYLLTLFRGIETTNQFCAMQPEVGIAQVHFLSQWRRRTALCQQCPRQNGRDLSLCHAKVQKGVFHLPQVSHGIASYCRALHTCDAARVGCFPRPHGIGKDHCLRLQYRKTRMTH